MLSNGLAWVSEHPGVCAFGAAAIGGAYVGYHMVQGARTSKQLDRKLSSGSSCLAADTAQEDRDSDRVVYSDAQRAELEELVAVLIRLEVAATYDLYLDENANNEVHLSETGDYGPQERLVFNASSLSANVLRDLFTVYDGSRALRRGVCFLRTGIQAKLDEEGQATAVKVSRY